MAESDGRNPRTKKRGVRASRIKLERVLADSDLERKTQAALADRIADIEGLSAAPKDLVSKVFREMPVDPQTLERVARGLGVDAKRLYCDAADRLPERGDAMSDTEGRRRGEAASSEMSVRLARIERIQTAAFVSLLFSFLLLGASLAVRPAGPLCGVREVFERPHSEKGKLGIVVARFSGDADNLAQQYLAASLAHDENLAPHTSIVATCARPQWTGPGDLRRKLANIREAGRKKLAKTGGHVLLWGEYEGDEVVVRFITPRRDVSPYAVEVSGRLLKVEEENIELRVPVGKPGEALADLKRLALELSAPEDEKLAALRVTALETFNSSADWLRAAVISQRNLSRSIDPALDPARWAAINMQLCYDSRLLGDHDARAGLYRDAIDACDNALALRSRDSFPSDWAALQTNKASSLIRLHYYADGRDESLELLREAEAVLISVIETEAAPRQRRITAQRNLGAVYVRLGELTRGGASSEYFEKGVDSLTGALKELDPAVQPFDWAITQQNICLALYQYGARIGVAGAPLVREAKERCRKALTRLSPGKTAPDWAMAKNNLAAATAILAQLEGDANGLSVAAGEFRAAQRIYRRETLPENWAQVEINLGELYCNLAVMRGGARDFDTALSHLDAAMEVLIETGNGRYRLYAENLVAAISRCKAGGADGCVCSG